MRTIKPRLKKPSDDEAEYSGTNSQQARATDEQESECPRCGRRWTSTLTTGPTTHYVQPCGCRVGDGRVMTDGGQQACQKPRCRTPATETYVDGFDNKLELCEEHYFKAVHPGHATVRTRVQKREDRSQPLLKSLFGGSGSDDTDRAQVLRPYSPGFLWTLVLVFAIMVVLEVLL